MVFFFVGRGGGGGGFRAFSSRGCLELQPLQVAFVSEARLTRGRFFFFVVSVRSVFFVYFFFLSICAVFLAVCIIMRISGALQFVALYQAFTVFITVLDGDRRALEGDKMFLLLLFSRGTFASVARNRHTHPSFLTL